MFNTANLSLEQAPPISVPFRFFLTAPLFGILVGLLGLWLGGEMFSSRWVPATLAATHLITLGMLALVMCGAMMQMLPVLAGIPVPRVVPVGASVHLLLTLGALGLAGSFLSGSEIWMFCALIGLGAGFLIFIGAIGVALWRVRLTNYTVTGMRVAILSLVITLLLGLALGGGVAGFWRLDHALALTDVHLGWGVLGWIGLLLIGVSYQVVPMFQVTPEYPLWLRRHGTLGVFGGLLLWLALSTAGMLNVLPAWPADMTLLLLGVAYAVFVAITLNLLRQRRRRIMNVTLLFWYLGIFAAFAALSLWIAGLWAPGVAETPEYPLLLGLLLLVGAGLSFVNGMLYRIVPFLSWFHLQNRQLALMSLGVSIPNMKELLPDLWAKRQFHTHLAALLLGLSAVFFPQIMARPAALMFGLSSLLLLINLVLAARRYQRTYHALMSSSEHPTP